MADDAMQVLLASDDSVAARAAETWLTNARWSRPPRVRVLSVAAPTVAATAWLSQVRHESLQRAIAEMDQAEQSRALEVAQEVARRLGDAGLEASGHAAHGEAAHEILMELERSGPDLVAVGPRGRSDFSAALLGTVTQQLLSHSTVPVLVARPGGVPAGPLPQTLVLMASGTLAIRGAIDWLTRAGWLGDTRVVIAGLLGASPGLEPPQADLADAITAELRLAAMDVLNYLQGLVEPHAREVTVELHMGQPLQAAMAVGAQHQADLLVVGRYPPRPGDQPFADKLARYASTSVLLVPTTEVSAAGHNATA
jgi:nucleotide-binding universal stress UspA family protein